MFLIGKDKSNGCFDYCNSLMGPEDLLSVRKEWSTKMSKFPKKKDTGSLYVCMWPRTIVRFGVLVSVRDR